MNESTDNRKESRPHYRRLAQWRVKWLIEHSTSHQLLWCIESFMLRNPPLRQAPKRQAVKKSLFSADNQLSQSNIFVLSQAEFCYVWVSVKNI